MRPSLVAFRWPELKFLCDQCLMTKFPLTPCIRVLIIDDENPQDILFASLPSSQQGPAILGSFLADKRNIGTPSVQNVAHLTILTKL